MRSLCRGPCSQDPRVLRGLGSHFTPEAPNTLNPKVGLSDGRGPGDQFNFAPRETPVLADRS